MAASPPSSSPRDDSLQLKNFCRPTYEGVLLRQRRDLNLTREDVGDLIDAICALATWHDIHFLWRPYLRDPRDHLVLEVTVAAGCEYIVSYNKRDFRGVEKFGVEVVDAREFLETIGELS
ncbi:MAG: PIN domain-containing protein [Bacteroidetes bacterium]|nr:PIN domain-containing protein [Bacteroidota bacterium]